jgi:AraC-like DNA-binding protein
MTVDGPRAIDASWTSCRVGEFGLSLAKSERARVSRSLGSRSTKPDSTGLIHFQAQGFSQTEQCGRHAALFAGDLTFCRADEPYSIEISDRNAMFVIEFPWAMLAELGARRGLVLPNRKPGVGVLCGFVSSIFRQSWADAPSAGEAEAFADVLERLLGDALAAPDTTASSAGLTQRLLSFVEDNLGNGALRTGTIAGYLGIQPRDVQQIFAEMATTPTAYILRRRMAIAAHRLRTAESSLSDLAFELGFSDAPHFCRKFREHFGETPSSFARRHR